MNLDLAKLTLLYRENDPLVLLKIDKKPKSQNNMQIQLLTKDRHCKKINISVNLCKNLKFNFCKKKVLLNFKTLVKVKNEHNDKLVDTLNIPKKRLYPLIQEIKLNQIEVEEDTNVDNNIDNHSKNNFGYSKSQKLMLKRKHESENLKTKILRVESKNVQTNLPVCLDETSKFIIGSKSHTSGYILPLGMFDEYLPIKKYKNVPTWYAMDDRFQLLKNKSNEYIDKTDTIINMEEIVDNKSDSNIKEFVDTEVQTKMISEKLMNLSIKHDDDKQIDLLHSTLKKLNSTIDLPKNTLHNINRSKLDEIDDQLKDIDQTSINIDKKLTECLQQFGYDAGNVHLTDEMESSLYISKKSSHQTLSSTRSTLKDIPQIESTISNNENKTYKIVQQDIHIQIRPKPGQKSIRKTITYGEMLRKLQNNESKYNKKDKTEKLNTFKHSRKDKLSKKINYEYESVSSCNMIDWNEISEIIN
ncbi:hypothetical protein A3Q56_01855 [Intoshia linei]|uniref:Uncharacterized protein n=1 Tax=Intoshia linei TaxID=1819745 RepID=A0A177B831_9BILA|nr:hypothetical protein A3Q56_01855 [Intoshia linei]